MSENKQGFANLHTGDGANCPKWLKTFGGSFNILAGVRKLQEKTVCLLTSWRLASTFLNGGKEISSNNDDFSTPSPS